MTLDILPYPTAASVRLAPVEPRYASLFCFALLTAACALASFAFACATPFATFAVVAAAMLPLGPALLVVAAAWLVNQAIGFGCLAYPVDTHTILWGFAIGAAALVATATSTFVLRLLRQTGTPVAWGFALVGAYAAYEFVLFAATPILGGAGAFTLTIVGRLGVLSLLWLIVGCGLRGVPTTPLRSPASNGVLIVLKGARPLTEAALLNRLYLK
jgi:hypothetical protein